MISVKMDENADLLEIVSIIFGVIFGWNIFKIIMME